MSQHQDARVERAIDWGVGALVSRLDGVVSLPEPLLAGVRTVARGVLLDVLRELGIDTSAHVVAPAVDLTVHRGPRTPGHDEDV